MFKFVDDFKSVVKNFIGNLLSVLVVIIALLGEIVLIIDLISKENFSGGLGCVVSFLLGVVVWKFGAKFFPSVNKEKELNQRIKELENEIQKCEDERDMNRMVNETLNTIQMLARLELIQVDTAGYLVKDQLIHDVCEISELNQAYPHPSKIKEKLDVNIPDKIFYVKEKQHRQTFGIDLRELFYAEANDKVYICGLTFGMLHSYDNLPPNGGVDFCVLENTNANRLESRFITSSNYDVFKNEYKDYHNQLFIQEMDEKANSICEKFTSNMHNMLKSRYVNIEFVKNEDEYEWLPWQPFSSIGDSSSRVVPRIAYDIFTGLNMVRNVE